MSSDDQNDHVQEALRISKLHEDEDNAIAELRRELAEQELLLEEHENMLAGDESKLETMIKDLRRELRGCQDESWRMDQLSELEDMQEQLLFSMLPPGAMAQAAVSDPLAELSSLNAEMDEELDNLRSKLGSVKLEFDALHAQRQKLQEDLQRFEEEEEEEEEEEGRLVMEREGK
ncbi:hypothetical protein GUITHDRAFT_104450 [Guillardia theta CCMP2712]|uniref:Uncharacterized protein n=1 Tax=Guillardia theta (strain CCMP2712) TaxID=905079 RepID=L1JPQ9_GUITC|nr:hypothetical protein GUITHDRAFT_104450 [Guillardia theta CCMP2712]EKX50053.1 hypothetical protein GUITHDRAFT_104450 [Guillardia theta CCMP2712]|eukprot:XP_005837033.1 hypothetical protein GUITHDRAFT_104450 [Guillardia theta CCMP2712]